VNLVCKPYTYESSDHRVTENIDIGVSEFSTLPRHAPKNKNATRSGGWRGDDRYKLVGCCVDGSFRGRLFGTDPHAVEGAIHKRQRDQEEPQRKDVSESCPFACQ